MSDYSFLRCAVLLACAFTAATAYGAPRGDGGTVKYVYPLGNGEVVLAFDPAPAYCAQSGSDKQMLLKVNVNGVTTEGYKNIYAAALTAVASGKQVFYTYDDATSQCPVNAIKLMP